MASESKLGAYRQWEVVGFWPNGRHYIFGSMGQGRIHSKNHSGQRWASPICSMPSRLEDAQLRVNSKNRNVRRNQLRSMMVTVSKNISKTYNIKALLTAVDRYLWSQKRRALWLIGPEWAGKTSIFRMLTTLLIPEWRLSLRSMV